VTWMGVSTYREVRGWSQMIPISRANTISPVDKLLIKRYEYCISTLKDSVSYINQSNHQGIVIITINHTRTIIKN